MNIFNTNLKNKKVLVVGESPANQRIGTVIDGVGCNPDSSGYGIFVQMEQSKKVVRLDARNDLECIIDTINSAPDGDKESEWLSIDKLPKHELVRLAKLALIGNINLKGKVEILEDFIKHFDSVDVVFKESSGVKTYKFD